MNEKHYYPQTKEELKSLTGQKNIILGNIDTSLITDMSGLFYNSTKRNFHGIETWNVSNVKNMESMFSGARSFDHDISDWDVSNVQNMSYMFYEAESFNQDISTWNVSNVTDMVGMFELASSFNQDISAWDIGKVIDMRDLFRRSGMKEFPSWYN